MNNIRIPLINVDSRNNGAYLSGHICILRKYPFTSNTITGVESMTEPGQYDFANVIMGTAYQRWVGTHLSNIKFDKSFSDSNGKVLFKNFFLNDAFDYLSLTTAGVHTVDLAITRDSVVASVDSEDIMTLNVINAVRGVLYTIRIQSYSNNNLTLTADKTVKFNYPDGSALTGFPALTGSSTTDVFELVRFEDIYYARYYAIAN